MTSNGAQTLSELLSDSGNGHRGADHNRSTVSSEVGELSGAQRRLLRERLFTDVSEARTKLARHARRDGHDLTPEDERLCAGAAVQATFEQYRTECLQRGERGLSPKQEDDLTQEILDRAFGGGRLLRVWAQFPDALNLTANGSGPSRIELADGQIIDGPPIADDDDELYGDLRALASLTGVKEVQWDPTQPELELILDDGTRLTARRWDTIETFVTLRRPTLRRVTLGDLVAYGSMSPRAASLLGSALPAGLRVVISGMMNSGKTVLARAMAAALPSDAHVVTVESQRELLLHEHPDVYPRNVTTLEARPPNSEGRGEITLAEQIEGTQRMSPTVVIVGELRGAESTAFVKSVTQGYPCLTTVHGHSSLDAVSNVAAYYAEFAGRADYETALRHTATNVDLAVHMCQLSDGRRVLNSIRHVIDYRDGVIRSEELFVPTEGNPAVPHHDHNADRDLLDRLTGAGYDPTLSGSVPTGVRR